MRALKWSLTGLAVFFIYVSAATMSVFFLLPAAIAILITIPMHAARVSETFVPERAAEPEEIAEGTAEFDFYDNQSGEVFSRMTEAQRAAAAEKVRFK